MRLFAVDGIKTEKGRTSSLLHTGMNPFLLDKGGAFLWMKSLMSC